MSSAPWKIDRPVPRAIFDVPSQTTNEERLLFYWLASEKFTGAGEIVEVGALAGASTLCLAAGALENPAVRGRKFRLNVYDRFIADDGLCAEFFDRHYPGEGIKPGDDFSSLYRRNIAAVADHVDVHQIDARDLRWDGRPIEILFIDCALSAALYDHFMREFFPCLIPGRSWVIDQDFFFQNAPWIPINAEKLGMVPHYVEDVTLVSQVGPDTLSRVGDAVGFYAGLSADERIAVLRRHAEKYTPDARQLLQLQEAVILIGDNRFDEGVRIAAEIDRSPWMFAAKFRARQLLELARKKLAEHQGQTAG